MRSGSSLASCTKQIQAVRVYEHPKYANRLVLVDTPGFDDTHKSDMEILQMISDWLKKTYFFYSFFPIFVSFPYRKGVSCLLGTRKVSNLQELCIYTKSPTIACLAHLIATYACFPSYAVIKVWRRSYSSQLCGTRWRYGREPNESMIWDSTIGGVWWIKALRLLDFEIHIRPLGKSSI